MEENKNYEEYLNKVRAAEKMRSEADELTKKLNEDYKDVIASHKEELDNLFKDEQRKLGLSLEGKYYRLKRKMREEDDVTIVSYFKLDKFERYDGERNQPFVRFLMYGSEVMTLVYKDGTILQMNSHVASEDKKELGFITFVLVNDATNTTEEITAEDFNREVDAIKNVYYSDILK